MLDKSGKSKYPCSVSDFREKAFNYLPIKYNISYGFFCKFPSIAIGEFPSIGFSSDFVLKGCWILSKAFSLSIR